MKLQLALVAVLATAMLSGCAQDGSASDVIARVYKEAFDGCADTDGYNGWHVQLQNDHPTEDSDNSYQIKDSMVSQAEDFADRGVRVRIQFEGSVWVSDCDRITSITEVSHG